ncbi:MAG TPA: endonuclease/exonuclease/phosphatase family protein [Candidatus Hydrogenedentes bacterium]|nr:MAG: Endonuclease/Exonuclease/phosphatase family protein [Candidatus Hydrogenedentes bacterium ADurb.Bin101]HOC68465.1 endonuclease/exonuclease/phosphatase family protein [Candidatus Hydrogenedentota bacterium]HQN00230.1 endonuclease/exonuclease/phosphatase family protein [Candidatus Hydrogenedentota bacterium]
MDTIQRRHFLKLAAGLLGTGMLARAGEENTPFRTISYNVLAFRGFPKTDATRSRLEGACDRHPEMTAEALAAFTPDIVTLQEGPSEALVKRFAKALGMRYAYFPGGWEGNAEYPGGFPGAIVTRFDIVASENRPTAGAAHDEILFTRHLGRAELDTPFGRLHVVSTHFHAQKHEVRMLEAAAIVALITKLRETGSVLLQGDLNHRPDAPEYKVWVEAGLVDIGARQGIGEQPTAPSIRPRSRIDYIWTTPELAARARHAEVLDKPPFIPEPEDPSTYALSDHLPMLAAFG